MAPIAIVGLSAGNLTLPSSPVVISPDAEQAMTLERMAPTLVQMGGLSLSLGSMFWLSRASTLLTSLLVSTPVWRDMDPLPVLASGGMGGDDDDLNEDERAAEDMFSDAPSQSEDVQLIG